MSSWWSTRGVLDGLDLEENSIVARVIQAVGLFGDILDGGSYSSSGDEEVSVTESMPDRDPDPVPGLEPDSEKVAATGGPVAQESGEDKETGTLVSEKENMGDAPKDREPKNPGVTTEGEQHGHVYKVDDKKVRMEEVEGQIKNTAGQRTEEEKRAYVVKGGDEKAHGGQMARAEEEVERAENGGQEGISKEEVEEEGGERGEKGEESVCPGVSDSWNEEPERGTETERNSPEQVVAQEGREGEMVNGSKSEEGRTREDQAEHEEDVEEGRGRGNGREKEIQMEIEEEGEEWGARKERELGRGDEVRREEGGVEEEEEHVQVTEERGSEEEEDGLGLKEEKEGKEDQGETIKKHEGGVEKCCPEISPPGAEISCCPGISSCCPETSPPGGEKTERKEKQVAKREVIVGREEGEEAEGEAGRALERTDNMEKDGKAGEKEQESKAIKEIAAMAAGEGTDKQGEGEVNPATKRADSDSCQPSPMPRQRDSDTESADCSRIAGVSNEASNNGNTGQGGSEVDQGPCPKNVGATGTTPSGVCLTSPSNDNKRQDTLSGGGPELGTPAQSTGPESPSETTSPSPASLNPNESTQAVVPTAPLPEATCGSGTEPDKQPTVNPSEPETRPEGNQGADDGVPAQTSSPPADLANNLKNLKTSMDKLRKATQKYRYIHEFKSPQDLSPQPAEPPGETTPPLEDKAKDIPPQPTDLTATPLAEKVTPMDATAQPGTGQGDKQAKPTTQKSASGGKTSSGVTFKAPEPQGSTAAEEKKDEEAAGSNELNGETTAGDDEKDGGEATKYKTVSYRRIRKGNTKQRIDEFESFLNS